MSRLLFDEQPLVVDKTLAKLIGLNEAIVLQQVHYWININQKANKNFHDGRYWTYNSIRAWHEENFDFWSYDTVKRIVAKLEKLNLLISGNFNQNPRDRTKWYSINYEVLETLKNSIGEKCPNVEETRKPLENAIVSKCPNAIGQNEPTQKGKMPQPLPEITTEITTEISLSPSVSHEEFKKEDNSIDNKTDGRTDKPKDINQIIKKIETRLDINSIKEANPHDLKLIDEIMLNIFDMYFSDYTTIQGQNKPRELVRAAIMKLNFFHIQELLSKYREISTTTQIKSPKAYMQSMIYNIAFENDLAVTNKIGYEWG